MTLTIYRACAQTLAGTLCDHELYGTSICDDDPLYPDDACIADPTLCKSCSTFNQADVDHIKLMGWNAIRLSVFQCTFL